MERGTVADWLVPSIGDVLFLSIFIWTLCHGVGLLNDGDTGWHLVTGENILRTLKVPHSDPYSYTMPGIPWTSHEWLAAVIFALVHRVMGLNGVVLFSATVICLTMLGLYKYMLIRGTSPLVAALMTVVATAASTLHWLARPHLFSLPLTLAFIVILELYQREGKDGLRLLPLLMALWVNLHAGFILGIMLILLYAGGNLFLCLASGEGRELYRERARKLWLMALITVLAASINPHGPAILYFPFHLVGREYIMDNVMEWLSPNFHSNKIFELMLLLYAAIFVTSRKKPDIFEGGAALLMTHMSLYSARYIPLMALIVTPMAAVRAGDALVSIREGAAGIRIIKRVGDRLERVSNNIKPLQERFNRQAWVYAAVAGCLLIGLGGGSIAGARVFDYTHDKKIFPVDALDFAVKNNISGNIYNNDGWGGYIIYKTYPRYKVFFDGRSDMYGVPFMKQYVRVARAELGGEEILDKYKVSWVIYDANSAICQLLVAGGRWKLVYADKTADILLRDVPENRALIDKYRYARFVPNDEEG